MKHIEKLSCFWEEDMITYWYSLTNIFFCLERLFTLNGKATFFFFSPPMVASRLPFQVAFTWPPAEIWLQGWDLGSATCVYIFYQNEGSFHRFQVYNQLIGTSPCNHTGPFTRLLQLKKKSFVREERNNSLQKFWGVTVWDIITNKY